MDSFKRSSPQKKKHGGDKSPLLDNLNNNESNKKNSTNRNNNTSDSDIEEWIISGNSSSSSNNNNNNKKPSSPNSNNIGTTRGRSAARIFGNSVRHYNSSSSSNNNNNKNNNNKKNEQRSTKSRSLEPKRTPPKLRPLYFSTSSSSSSKKKAYLSLNHCDTEDDGNDIITNKAVPIPKETIECIQKVFGINNNNDIDLYKDVLELSSSDDDKTSSSNNKTPDLNYSPAKLRVAYFRRGRQVLQEQNNSPASVLNGSTIKYWNCTAKERFQAVTKAYEILTNPGYKAYYEKYGLTINNDDNNGKQGYSNSNNEEDLEVQSVISRASSASSRSILKRSNSWGPHTRCSHNRRLRWNEQVEELVYHPDSNEYREFLQSKEVDDDESVEVSVESFQNHSVDASSAPSDEPPMKLIVSKKTPKKSGKKKKKTKQRFIIDMPKLSEDLENFDESFQKDFLDDIEASIQGLESKIGGFIRYATSDTEDDNNNHNNNNNNNNSNNENDDDEEEEPTDDSIVRQLFTSNESTKINSISRCCSTSSDDDISTTIPLKTGDEPKSKVLRNKASSSNKQQKQTSYQQKQTNSDVFDPFGLNETNDDDDTSGLFGPSSDPLQANGKKASNNNNKKASDEPSASSDETQFTANTSFVSTEKAFKLKNKRSYDIPDADSILASVNSTISVMSEESKTNDNKEEEQSFDLVGPPKAMSFDESLIRSSEFEAKELNPVNNRSKDDTAVNKNVQGSNTETNNNNNNVNTSSHTKTKSSPDFTEHLHELMNGWTKQAQETINAAQETIRAVSPIPQGVNNTPVTDQNNNKVQAEKKESVVSGTTTTTTKEMTTPAPESKATTTEDETTFFTTFNQYMQNFANDMNKFGTQLSTNLDEANKAVISSLTLPENEVCEMLKVLDTAERDLWSSDQRPKTDTNDNYILRSFTY